jgi:enoyl-CoA hydratase
MIADNAPMTIHALKYAVGARVRGNQADLETSDRLVKACFDSQGYIEGSRAFMKKRRPVFRGG